MQPGAPRSVKNNMGPDSSFCRSSPIPVSPERCGQSRFYGRALVTGRTLQGRPIEISKSRNLDFGTSFANILLPGANSELPGAKF